jgi:hypothetical protein
MDPCMLMKGKREKEYSVLNILLCFDSCKMYRVFVGYFDNQIPKIHKSSIQQSYIRTLTVVLLAYRKIESLFATCTVTP